VPQPLQDAQQAVTRGEAPADPAPTEVIDVESTPSLPVSSERRDPPAELVAEEPPTQVSPSFREQRITEFGDDEITMVFSEDCWVEVKSADGENLYSDLNRTGRTLVLAGRAPFRVLLGYAPGVTLSFNGEPVPLARYSRNNVANLVLGE
jgi:cytoskeleton protein RodZ